MKTKTLVASLLLIAIISSYACQPDTEVYTTTSHDCSRDTLTTSECAAPSPDSGAITGYHINYYSGTTFKKNEGYYVAGVPADDSVFIFYHINLDVKSEEGVFVNGQRSGTWTGYTVVAKLDWSGTFSNCDRTDIWTFYHTDGSVKEQGLFENSVRKGLWNIYDITGKLVQKTTYSC